MATILIVDDRPANREYLVTLLGYGGHRLLEAADGEAALAVARAERPDLIITDIVMPTMDGYELAQQVRTDPAIAETQIVFITATYSMAATQHLAQACGVAHIITKPAEPQTILDTVSAALQTTQVLPVRQVTEAFHRDHMRVLTDTLAKEEALAAKNEELKVMSQQLWHTAKLATMGELAASIAHELNNPLATVSLRVEDLLTETLADDPKRRALEVIDQEVERMGMLVSNLLQFSRRGQPQISTLEVQDEIVKTLELVHYLLRQRRIGVVQDFAPDVPMIQADRQQLRQLFLNLFTNASDAMPDGGTLTIRVGAEEQQVVIEINDTGVGIAPEDLPKVLEPFFTTKPEGKGTGLGLAICRRVVQEHGGAIDIRSEGIPGKGTTVRLTLPSQAGLNGSYLIQA